MKNTENIVSETLTRLREKSPLVLALTNSVVRQITANLLLAVGAAPVMLNDASECEELIHSCASALLVNLGTLSHEQAAVMRTAVNAANTQKIPWVLDPVAVGLLGLRSRFAQELLALQPSVIRGNAAEILALAGYDAKPRGPESTCESDAAVNAAGELSLKTGAIVLVTGETDYVTDGRLLTAFSNGHAMMTRVTGVGCAMGALTAACVAVAESPFAGAAASAGILGIAGEIAFENSGAPGTFAAKLLDALYELTEDEIRSRLKIAEIG